MFVWVCLRRKDMGMSELREKVGFRVGDKARTIPIGDKSFRGKVVDLGSGDTETVAILVDAWKKRFGVWEDMPETTAWYPVSQLLHGWN